MAVVLNASFYDWFRRILHSYYNIPADRVLKNRLDNGHRDYETRSVLYRIFYDEFMMSTYDIGKIFGVSHKTVHNALQVLEPQQYNTVQRDIYRQLTKRIIKHVEDKDEKRNAVGN